MSFLRAARPAARRVRPARRRHPDLGRRRHQLRRRVPVPVLHAGLRRPHRRRDRPGRVRLRQLPDRPRLGVRPAAVRRTGRSCTVLPVAVNRSRPGRTESAMPVRPPDGASACAASPAGASPVAPPPPGCGTLLRRQRREPQPPAGPAVVRCGLDGRVDAHRRPLRRGVPRRRAGGGRPRGLPAHGPRRVAVAVRNGARRPLPPRPSAPLDVRAPAPARSPAARRRWPSTARRRSLMRSRRPRRLPSWSTAPLTRPCCRRCASRRWSSPAPTSCEAWSIR